MKPTQNTIIHILLGVAVLTAFALFYLLLAPPDQSGLSSPQWVLFAAFTLVLVLGAFGRSFLHRLRGLPPPKPLLPAEITYCILVTVIVCPLSILAILVCGPLGSVVIMLVPIAFILGPPRRVRGTASLSSSGEEADGRSSDDEKVKKGGCPGPARLDNREEGSRFPAE